MESTRITLNEQTYTVKELSSRKNMEWRQKLEEPFQELATLLATAPNIVLSGKDAKKISTESLPQLSDMLKILVGRVAGSIDIMVYLLFEYCEDLQPKRAEILEVSYDSELIEAFAQVIKLAYPFGKLASVINIQANNSNG